MICQRRVTLSVTKGLTLLHILPGISTTEYQARDIPALRWSTQEVIVTLKAVELQSTGDRSRSTSLVPRHFSSVVSRIYLYV